MNQLLSGELIAIDWVVAHAAILSIFFAIDLFALLVLTWLLGLLFRK